MEEAYDVVVIGAGFGGPVAARKCALAGLKTLMLERAENVGEKVVSGLTIPIYGFLFAPDFIRDGNPPIERPTDGIVNYIINDIDAGDIEVDNTLRVPRPFSPVVAFGYNAYCKPFCQWLANKAVEAGAELRTSATVADVIWSALPAGTSAMPAPSSSPGPRGAPGTAATMAEGRAHPGLQGVARKR
jgi:flavin-dependent dehydrogenase